jgi:hypothetical protein
VRDPAEAQLNESLPLSHAGHLGRRTPGAVRHELTRDFPDPHFYHFASDLEGTRLISDAGPFSDGGRVFLAHLGRAGTAADPQFTYLLNPRCSCRKQSHIHPFLSPDGRMGFFNSDESGLLQAYLIRGLDTIRVG